MTGVQTCALPIWNIDASLKVPHMGWNELLLKQDHPVFKDIQSEDCVYFVHSYYADTIPSCQIAVTDYSIPVTAAAGKGNVLGCQFHPEKSGETGLKILKAFCEWDGIVK